MLLLMMMMISCLSIHHGIIESNDQADETNVSDAQKALNLKDPYHLIILL